MTNDTSSVRTLQHTDENISGSLSSTSVESLPAQINRDLSLLRFFERILEEAADGSLPVLERLKFLAIFSSGLDEFFMIRVSGLMEKLGQRVGVSPDGYSRPELLAEIRVRVTELIDSQMKILRDDLLPELAGHGIILSCYSDLSTAEKRAADEFFREKVYPTLTPQAVDPTHPFPYISGGSINLALMVKPTLNKRVSRAMLNFSDEFFVRIEIPDFVERFVPVGESKYVLVEEVIAENVWRCVPEADPAGVFHFRIARDADIDLREEEADDLLQMMEENLRQRRFGDVVRLEVSKDMPRGMIDYLSSSLEITEDEIYVLDGPMNLVDAFSILNVNRPDLKDKPIRITEPAVFKTGQAIFEIIRNNDVLLHHPYNPYSLITDLIREAAHDPDVLAIKICLYRIGEDSPIAPLLIEASESGKQVTALIEIKARFDEANNIEWGKRLERAGVHVVYGLLGLKTHAKTTLIVRREGDELRRYMHLATGNYNPATSTVYTDLGLLTADQQTGADATELFNYLTAYSRRESFTKLLVAPINLRQQMIQMINREAENACNGKPARIIAKINRIADAAIVNTLYEASKAGVEIDLIVRSICTLRPGVPGLSENIRVRSIVGRLLEHSRVYYFENAGQNEVYIGSSDWMPRNLDRRVEVLTPVINEGIREFLKSEYLTAYLRDNVKARELDANGSYRRVYRDVGEEPFDCQLGFQEPNNIVEFEMH